MIPLTPLAALLLGQAWAGDVLDDALARVGTNRSAFTAPRALERDYNLACRVPVVDEALARPYSLPTFWRGFADALSPTVSSPSAAYRLAHATLDGGADAPEVPQLPVVTDRAALDALLAELFPTLSPDERASAWHWDPEQPAVYTLVGRVASALIQAAEARAAAYASVDVEALEALDAARLGYFFGDDGYEFLTVGQERMARLTSMADSLRPIAPTELVASGHTLVAASELLLAERSVLEPPGESVPGPVFELMTPQGRIVVGGWGDDRWIEPVAALIDLGGDDLYGAGVGAASETPGGLAWVVDLEGRDRYHSPDRPGQGSGTLGVGVLVDGSGDDLYVAGDQAQGSAFGGVGVLVDVSGDDTYVGRSLVQGASAFGLGLLLDGVGDDRFVSDGLSQGFGSTLGIGLLHDGAGDDLRECGSWNGGERQLRLGNCQGGAVGVRPYPWVRDPSHYGGLGFLVDDGGDDRYDARINSQGGSYFLGLGALFDRAGDDHYAGHREQHQGGSMHLGAAILTDLEGDDVYEGFDSAQAAGNDRSVGFLLDHGGDDVYVSAFGNSQAYSRKANSLSVLVEASGDDRYVCPSEGDERCQAYAQLTSTPQDQSTVVFLDLGGTDTYDEAGRADGSIWQEQPLVVGVDTEAPMPVFDAWTLVVPPASLSPLAQFHRVGVEPVVLEEAAFAAWLRRGLRAARRDGGAERYLETEQLTLLATRDALGPEQREALAAWLSHPRPETRAQVAEILGRSHDGDVDGPLLRALRREASPSVRLSLIEALGQREVVSARTELLARLQTDADAACRRQALTALQAIGLDDAGAGVVLRALLDPSPAMRFAAAMALAEQGDPAHVEALAARADEPDPWVRRALARALMASGDERGIPLMIGTMDFYSLDNSYYAWGRDIGNVLRHYTNVAFTRDDGEGGTERDDLSAERWTAWWSANAGTFAIEPLLPAARLVDEGDRLLREKRPEEAALKYASALELVPDYLPALERLE